MLSRFRSMARRHLLVVPCGFGFAFAGVGCNTSRSIDSNGPPSNAVVQDALIVENVFERKPERQGAKCEIGLSEPELRAAMRSLEKDWSSLAGRPLSMRDETLIAPPSVRMEIFASLREFFADRKRIKSTVDSEIVFLAMPESTLADAYLHRQRESYCLGEKQYIKEGALRLRWWKYPYTLIQ